MFANQVTSALLLFGVAGISAGILGFVVAEQEPLSALLGPVFSLLVGIAWILVFAAAAYLIGWLTGRR